MKKLFVSLILVYIQTVKTHSIDTEFGITFDPPLVRGLNQWQTVNITFTVESTANKTFDDEFELMLSCVQKSQYHRQVLEINGQNRYVFNISDSEPSFSAQFQIKALFLGYSNITSKLMHNKTIVQTLDNYSVSVVRKSSPFDIVFTLIIVLMVTVNYVNMGCHLDLNIVKETLKRPIGPVIGFVCQFTVMPIASYLIGWLLLDDISLRLGLFTLGCSPGGNSSNFWTLLFNGDVNLSITMTFISTIAALVMMPFWLFTLGRTLFTSVNIKIPYFNLLTSLISLTFPMAIGIAIRHFRPNWAQISQKIIRPFTIVVVIVGITGSAIVYNHIFLMFTWPIAIAGALVAISGYSLGAIASAVFGMKRAQVIAISIETAYQNGGIAFILLVLSLQQPDADIASVPCLAQLLITGQPLWLVFIGVKIWSYFHSKSDKSIDNKAIEQKIKTITDKDKSGYEGPYGRAQVTTECRPGYDDKNGVKQTTKF